MGSFLSRVDLLPLSSKSPEGTSSKSCKSTSSNPAKNRGGSNEEATGAASGYEFERRSLLRGGKLRKDSKSDRGSTAKGTTPSSPSAKEKKAFGGLLKNLPPASRGNKTARRNKESSRKGGAELKSPYSSVKKVRAKGGSKKEYHSAFSAKPGVRAKSCHTPTDFTVEVTKMTDPSADGVGEKENSTVVTQARRLDDEYRREYRSRKVLQPVAPSQHSEMSDKRNKASDPFEKIHQQKQNESSVSAHRVQKKFRSTPSPTSHKNTSSVAPIGARYSMAKVTAVYNQADSSKPLPDCPGEDLGATWGIRASAEEGIGRPCDDTHHNYHAAFSPDNDGAFGGSAGEEQFHHWTVPPFLGPLAATIRRPFSACSSATNDHTCFGGTRHSGIDDFADGLASCSSGCHPGEPVENHPGEENSTLGISGVEVAEDTRSRFMAMSTEASTTASAARKEDFSCAIGINSRLNNGRVDENVARASVIGIVDSALSAEKTVSIRRPSYDGPSMFAPFDRNVRGKGNENLIQESSRDGNAKKKVRDHASRDTESRIANKTDTRGAHQARSPYTKPQKLCRSTEKVLAEQAECSAGRADADTSFSPDIQYVLGKRVTMIDNERKVFVIDLLSPETCNLIRRMTDDHVREVHESGSNAETWRTLYTYTKMDLPVSEVKDMTSTITEGILHEVKKIVGEIFGMKKDAMKLRPRSWKEPHLLLYQALDDKPHHTGIEMHYDGCDITWQAMLSRITEYEGGGTYFRCLQKTIQLQQGQILVHPGELYHKGVDITGGVRCLLVCFTDGMNPNILDDSKQEDDDPEYQKNVFIC